MPTLTLKQQRFVEFYNKSGNGLVSAREAGYKGNDGQLATIASQNLIKPYVLTALRLLQHAREARSNRTQADMSAMLWTIMDSEDEAARDKIGAASLEARLNGWIVERSERKDMKLVATVDVSTLSAEERANFLALGAAIRALPQGRTAKDE